MAAVHDIYYGVLAASPTTLEIRPPIGEMWQITNYEQDDTAAFPVLNYTNGATNAKFSADITNAVGGMWVDNTTWAVLTNTTSARDYCAIVIKYQIADVPMRVVSISITSDGTNVGAGEFRPPVGTDWMAKALMAGGSGVILNFKNGTLTTSGSPQIAIGSDVVLPGRKYGAAVAMPLSNTFWVRLSHAVTGTILSVLTYAEMAAGSMDVRTSITTVGASGFSDIRAPLGEIWTVGAWAGGLELVAYDGVTRNAALSELWPRLKAMKTVGNAKWLQIAAGVNSVTVAWTGWRHPL